MSHVKHYENASDQPRAQVYHLNLPTSIKLWDYKKTQKTKQSKSKHECESIS